MYTLYYLNRSHQLRTIKALNLDEPVLIPEDLVFCNLRKGINFIKEPHKCIDFTDTERLIMNSEFTDINLLKDFDYRKQNTYLTALCEIDGPLVFDFAPDYWDNESLPTFRYNSYDDGEYEIEHEIYFSLDGVTFDRFDKVTYGHENGVVDHSGGKTHIAIYLVPELRIGENYNTVRHYNYVYFKDLTTGQISETYDVSAYWA